MAGKRKDIGKKLRYEVFKRDKFTCQYCGRTSPDVILQVDHIKPVSKGGTNDIMNLVTSCRDCNLGKGATELSDDTVVKKQQKRLKELAERNEQLEMMLQWRTELLELRDNQVELINDYLQSATGYEANEHGKETIQKWVKKYPMDIIYQSIDIAFEKYYTGSTYSWSTALDKVNGVCRNVLYDREHKNDPCNKLYYYNYLAKACRNKYRYWDSETIHYYVEKWLNSDEDFESAKSVLKYSRDWGDFKENMEDEFNN